MRSRWFGLVVAALAAAVSVWAYPQLPPTVATHWNLRGAPDGFSSRTLAVAIMPAVILVMRGVFRVLDARDGSMVYEFDAGRLDARGRQAGDQNSPAGRNGILAEVPVACTDAAAPHPKCFPQNLQLFCAICTERCQIWIGIHRPAGKLPNAQ